MGRRRYISHYSGPAEPAVEHRRAEQAPPPPSRMRRWLRRHRWQLVPVHVATGAYAVAAVADVAPALGYGTLALASAGGLALAQRLSPAERLYAWSVTGGAAGWVLIADLVSPWSWSTAALWAAALLAGGRPWWFSHRVRGRIRVDALIEAWPDWSARAQLGGVRVVSGQAGRVYDRLRLELVRGQQRARHVVDHLEDLASVRGIPPWRLRVDEQGGGADPGQLDLLVTHTDPWRDDQGRPVDLPHPATTDLATWCQPASIRQPIPYGIEAGGSAATVQLRDERGGKVVALVAKKGSGKTVLLHGVLAGLCRAEDADVAVIDLKEGGKASRPWAPRLIRRATTLPEAIALLDWAARENDRRGSESPDPVLRPSRTRRSLVVVIDEYGALALAGGEQIVARTETLARVIRSASGGLVIADQHVGHETWSGALLGQVDAAIAGRLEQRRYLKALFPRGTGGVDVTEFDLPGQVYQRTGTQGSEARSWYLEDPAEIAAIVEACRDRWPTEQAGTVPVNTSRSTLETTMELPRGAGAEAVRAQIRDQLNAIAAQDLSGVPDLTAEQMRERAQPPAPPTAEESTLDERIMEALRAAPPGGMAMADLEALLEVPRSTIQVRCSVLRREGRAYTNPPKGRYARWHVTPSDEPAMANA